MRQSSADHRVSIHTDQPLLRAKETAEIIASRQNCQLCKFKLIERDFGLLSGLTPLERQTFEKKTVRWNGTLMSWQNGY
ncbi:MAG: histidine phosphatase family protein [Eisenbergiella sp.]